MAELFDYVTDLGVGGITVSPGFSYSRAPRQDVFLQRQQTKDTVSRPLKALQVALRGPRTEGPMAPELPIEYDEVEVGEPPVIESRAS